MSRRLFLFLSPSLRQLALSGTPPVPPTLPRAGYGCAVSSRPSPAPGPGTPLRPAPRAGSRPLHPGTDSSRPDSGTMVMAEGTAVLRQNRPGTKAQDFYNWPDESFDEMDSTLAVQQVIIIVSFATPIT